MEKGWNNGEKKRSGAWAKRIAGVKTWQLVILLIIFAMLAAIFLRLNNIGMIERRTVVVEADKSGDREKLNESIANLQKYIANHMNTYMGARGVALQNTYNADVDAAVSAVRSSNIDQNAYNEAAAACRPSVANGWNAYLDCIKTRAGTSDVQLEQPKLPNENLYYVNFVPPRWSPDVAGFMVLICVAICVLIIYRMIAKIVMYIALSDKSRRL